MMVRQAYDEWVESFPATATDNPSDYATSPAARKLIEAASGSFDELDFLVQKMEADPEYNRFCLAIYDLVAPSDLVAFPSDNLSPMRAVRSVILYRRSHPCVPSPMLPKRTKCLALIGISGATRSGRESAARVIGSGLLRTKTYRVFKWSFRTLLRNFCVRYYEGNAPSASFAYHTESETVPPCVRRWTGIQGMTIPPASEFSKTLIFTDPSAADRAKSGIWKRLSSELTPNLTARRILQLTWNAFRDACGVDFWTLQLANRMCAMVGHQSNDVHIIDDVLFSNEAAWLRSLGARVIAVDSNPTPNEPVSKDASELCAETRCEYSGHDEVLRERMVPDAIEYVRGCKSSC